MVRKVSRRLFASLFLVATTLFTSACFFSDLKVFVFFDEVGGRMNLSITTHATWNSCEDDGDGNFECVLFEEENISRFRISAPGLALLLLLLDPMVVQFPAEAHGFEGAFVHHESGASDSLAITAGLSSVPVDSTQALVAEPGMQLVVIDLPPGAPLSGDVTLEFRFKMPFATEVAIKPVFTGRVDLTDGRVFYVPLYPCMTDMAQVPQVVISIPPGGGPADVTLPLPDFALSCDGETYIFDTEDGNGDDNGNGTPPAAVLIDILPGSERNPVNPNRNGDLPVAVLTTAVADGDTFDFDATAVDASTLAFGPAGAAEIHRRAHFEDIDDDGDLDLVLHFSVGETGIACGDTEATLAGSTFDGIAISGSDAIQTVGCR